MDGLRSSAAGFLAFALSAAALAFLSWPGTAEATPRYSARVQQNCNLCHDNPTGGGKRSAYAAQFLVPNEMSAVVWNGDGRLERLDGQLTSSVSVGADLRTIHLYSPDKAYRNDFLQMQGDFYIAVEVDPRFLLYMDRGQSQTRELFGLGYVLPANGYVKVGRFTPAYGWRFADHSFWVRSELGFMPPGETDTGVEIGIYPDRFALHLAVLNGAPGSTLDTDHRLSAVARGAARQRIGPASAALGVSYAYNESGSRLERRAGPFGSLHLGPLTWIGEADWRRTDRGAGGPALDEFVTSHEFTWALRRGVDLRATYDFYDPDFDRKSGARSRLGIGIDSLIYPFLGIQGMVHRWEVDAGPEVFGASEYTQSVVMAHFLF